MNRKHLLDDKSNSSSRSVSRARTPRPDGEENGQLDFAFSNLEELLSSKLENLEGWREQNYDFKQDTVNEWNRARITSSGSIKELIHSLQVSRNEVSSDSRELILAQLYKLIVVKSLLVYNESRIGTDDYVGEESVSDLIFILMRRDARSPQEFLLLYRCTIALIVSDIDEFSSLADGEFMLFMKSLITEPATAIITNENKSHVISGYVGLLMILHNGSSGYGIDSTISWLYEITEGYCLSALTSIRDFKEGNREYSTFFDDLSKQRIVNELTTKQNSEALIGIAGLHGVGCLLTLVPRNDFLNEIIEDLIPKLLELFDNELNVDISKASGRVIALCYEVYHYRNDEDEDNDADFNDNSPYYEQEEITSVLTRLVNLNDKKVSKKDKKDIHSIFRDILNTVENYGNYDTRIEILKRSPRGLEILSEIMDLNFIKLSKTRSIQINSWFLYIRLIHLKWCFSFGVHNQLISNPSARDVLKEPPTDFEVKYGYEGDEDEENNSSYYNDTKYEMDDKKRTKKLNKLRVNKLTEEMEDLGLNK
ncbi:hypothetical protein PSN45_004054 [Yamadazyma tenuis]|uniref:Interferon-related developmental regulator N-terminal domain-containing protein n=1 Tax=Candida tenuis (strain ATCC 10573 / BCRC 21748 / CBS 615 / JCM 9827 / NBRC 10315 / NRRL Y-1498 / VKM Y-70) TaxID=590646 RepID=G3B4U3_CANTC|nr:uncharacterized protein CANTEDRAFT_130249 [Yamadazyma tenuis ATCC 10573]EGV63871.1 hypothetical protein CANTEDRAFT_130249 [Yamadazyma tenuis ATCC 10573]WEJ96515.1 hypothetical protein PSN45_004054 [Yamadazyma tenuis]